ncbi:hypothetical protein BJV82DRAFT_663650 [Fennellomyces sp. T-0311]|nr:hypothetical protein BJV82DRAFT_663650 [Fennellomyces sp. T-0311]
MTATAINRCQAIVAHGNAYTSLTQNHLDLSAVQESFDQAKAAYAAQQYRTAIKSYTNAMNILQKIAMPTLLLHRAAAYEMEHDYDLALNDCQAANKSDHIKMLPDAYLGAASALIFQNKLSEAAQMYEKGINSVPETDCRRVELVKRRDQVVTELDNRNQWLVQVLPLEVLHRILSLVTVKDRTRLSQTCRYWHMFMLHQWPEMWSELDATEIGFMIKNPAVRQFLQSKAQAKVKKIKLNMAVYDARTAMEDNDRDVQALARWPSRTVIHFMLRQNWNQIESLELLDWDQELLIKILESSRGTIKTMKLRRALRESECCSAQVAGDLMKRFTTLRTVTIDTQASYQWVNEQSMPSIALPQGVYLTELAISCAIGKEQLINLLDNSPRLASFETERNLELGDESTVLEIVDKHCPALRTLTTSTPSPKYYKDSRFIATYLRSQRDARPPSTLEHLELLEEPVPSDSIYPMTATPTSNFDQTFIPMLQKCHGSLRTLGINLAATNASDHQWVQELSHLRAPQLRVLELCERHSTTFGPRKLVQVITACPSLQVIKLDGGSFWHDTVLRSLGQCTNLHELTISHDGYMPHTNRKLEFDDQGTISIGGLKSLFTQSKNLKRFVFKYAYQEHNYNTYRTYTPAPEIRRRSANRAIRYNNYVVDTTREPNNLSMQVVVGLAELLNGSSSIEEINLDCITPEAEMDGAIDILSGSNIRRLDITIYQDLSKKIINAFSQLHNLEYLCLHSDTSSYPSNHREATSLAPKPALINLLEKSKSTHHLTVIIKTPSDDGIKGCRPINISGHETKELEDLDAIYNIQNLKPEDRVTTKRFIYGRQFVSEYSEDEEDERSDEDTIHKMCPTCGHMSHYSKLW